MESLGHGLHVFVNKKLAGDYNIKYVMEKVA